MWFPSSFPTKSSSLLRLLVSCGDIGPEWVCPRIASHSLLSDRNHIRKMIWESGGLNYWRARKGFLREKGIPKQKEILLHIILWKEMNLSLPSNNSPTSQSKNWKNWKILWEWMVLELGKEREHVLVTRRTHLWFQKVLDRYLSETVKHCWGRLGGAFDIRGEPLGQLLPVWKAGRQWRKSWARHEDHTVEQQTCIKHNKKKKHISVNFLQC